MEKKNIRQPKKRIKDQIGEFWRWKLVECGKSKDRNDSSKRKPEVMTHSVKENLKEKPYRK